jgi:hypothetical protein
MNVGEQIYTAALDAIGTVVALAVGGTLTTLHAIDPSI